MLRPNHKLETNIKIDILKLYSFHNKLADLQSDSIHRRELKTNINCKFEHLKYDSTSRFELEVPLRCTIRLQGRENSTEFIHRPWGEFPLLTCKFP